MKYIYLKSKDGNMVGRYKSIPEGCSDLVKATKEEYDASLAIQEAKASVWRAKQPKH